MRLSYVQRQVASTENAAAFRADLVDFCGPEWTEERVPATCCSHIQLRTMVAFLNTSVFPFVETCPACWNNYKVAA